MFNTTRKLIDLFDGRERWELAGLLLMTVLMAVVQTVGIASILPFMSVVANPEIVTENVWMQRLYADLGFETTRAFLLFLGVLVLAIMTVSNVFSAFSTWLMLRFVWRKGYRLSVRLLTTYLREPYTFHLYRSTAALSRSVLVEVREVINGVLLPGMKAIAQTIVVVCISALLLMVDVTLALTSALVLGGAYGVVYVMVRRNQVRLGRVRYKSSRQVFKAVNEALGGIKETKVLGREEEFLKGFAVPQKRYTEANISNGVISQVPSYVLETLAFGGIILIVLYLLGTYEDFGQAVAVVSMYALAGYRLMPALQLIFQGLAKTRFYSAAIDGLHGDLVGRKKSSATPAVVSEEAEGLTFEREIAIDRVTYRYPGSEQSVTREISLSIPKNTSIALVGSTGSGKTTLVDIVLGLLDPQQGEIRVDGVRLTQGNIGAWRRKLGYVPQHIFLCDDTIVHNIAFGIPDENIDLAAVERAARVAHLDEFVSSLPAGYQTIVGERGVRLSGGQRQRIGIARALYHDPDVLILDEATSALDGITEDVVIQAVTALAHSKTIITIAHRLTTVRECDLIYLLDQGAVSASGTYDELVQGNPTFRAMAKEDRFQHVAAV